MNKSVRTLMCLVILSGLLVTLAQAGMVNYNRRRGGAQVNATTTTTTATTDISTTAESTGDVTTDWSWKTNMVRVQNSSEERFDYNNDGYLQRVEVTSFLQDAVRQIKSKGSLPVNSVILKEYDKNSDNSIDRFEMGAIVRDIGK